MGEHGHVLVRFQERGSDPTHTFQRLRERVDRLISGWATEALPEEMVEVATRPPGESPTTPKRKKATLEGAEAKA